MNKTKGFSRRDALKYSLGALGGTVGILSGSGVAARTFEEMCRRLTPAQPEGPFYPIDHRIEKDGDLTRVEGAVAEPEGQLIYVQGKVVDGECRPIPKALVEIWQACASGRYNHELDESNPLKLDPNFQYFGQALTDEQGSYIFKTIVPGHYPAGDGWIRPAHIHFKVSKLGFRELITQMYFGTPPFDRYLKEDFFVRELSEEDRRKLIIALEEPGAEFDPKALVGQFDITLQRVRRS